MRVCVCLCVCVIQCVYCVPVCMCICYNVCIQKFISMCVCVCMYVCMYIHAYSSVCVEFVVLAKTHMTLRLPTTHVIIFTLNIRGFVYPVCVCKK